MAPKRAVLNFTASGTESSQIETEWNDVKEERENENIALKWRMKVLSVFPFKMLGYFFT